MHACRTNAKLQPHKGDKLPLYIMGVVEPYNMLSLQPAGATRVTLDIILFVVWFRWSCYFWCFLGISCLLSFVSVCLLNTCTNEPKHIPRHHYKPGGPASALAEMVSGEGPSERRDDRCLQHSRATRPTSSVGTWTEFRSFASIWKGL